MQSWKIESHNPITPTFEQVCKGLCSEFTTAQSWELPRTRGNGQALPKSQLIAMSSGTGSRETMIIDLTEEEIIGSISEEVPSLTAKNAAMTQKLQQQVSGQPKSLVVTLKLRRNLNATPTTPHSQSGSDPISGQTTRKEALNTSIESLSGPKDSPETLPRVSHHPVDHDTRGLAEAWAYYTSRLPPFVVSGNSQTVHRSVYLVSIEGRRPKLAVAAQLTCKSWKTNKHIYWTLDVDHQRIIVKAFQSDDSIDGARYVYYPWVGVAQEFGPCPIAFSTLGNRYEGTPSHARQVAQTDMKSAFMGFNEGASRERSKKIKRKKIPKVTATKSVKKRKIRHPTGNRVSNETSKPLTSSPSDAEVQNIATTQLFGKHLRSSLPSSPTPIGHVRSSLPPSQGWQDILDHQQSVTLEASRRLQSRDRSPTPLLTPYNYIRPDPNMHISGSDPDMGGLDGSSEIAISHPDPSPLQLSRGRPLRTPKPTMKAASLKLETANSRKRKATSDDLMYSTPTPEPKPVRSAQSSPLSSPSSAASLQSLPSAAEASRGHSRKLAKHDCDPDGSVTASDSTSHNKGSEAGGQAISASDQTSKAEAVSDVAADGTQADAHPQAHSTEDDQYRATSRRSNDPRRFYLHLEPSKAPMPRLPIKDPIPSSRNASISSISPSITLHHRSSTTFSIPDSSDTSLPLISPYKQRHTILRATCTSTILGVVLLKLRSCMTIDNFFESIISATGYEDQKSSISTIMVTFDFKADDDSTKSILVKRNIVDSFEAFLEIIDKAPCWDDDEGGRCEVAVDVIYIGESGEETVP